MNNPEQINMGSAHDIMQTFAHKEIHAHFREFDGWKCRQVLSPIARDVTYILSREVRGRKECVTIAVSYDEEPSTLPLEALAATVKDLKGQYLVVPKAANVSAIPKPVRVIFMETFGFLDGKLVWLTRKKNAKHYPQSEEPARAGAAVSACEPHTA
ncbi:hypothetical protein [Methanoregula sp.]|uniref:hypothetical protein n=1 Tax=Methanoregula sp. TaxID=2052170 RepID=UPI003D0A7545